MKIFTEKAILKKLILILIAIIVFNAVIPTNVSYAADVGGVLLKPIADLMLALGDFIMDIIHNAMYGMDTAVVRIDKDTGIWEFLGILSAVVFAVIAIVAIGWAVAAAGIAIAGAFGATATISAATIGSIITTSIGGGIAAGAFARSEWFSHEYAMPVYRVTPEEIFSGNIRLLNVNFFSDEEINDEDIDTTVTIQNKEVLITFNPSEDILNDKEIKSADELTKAISDKVNYTLQYYGYTGPEIDWSQDSFVDHTIWKRWSQNLKAYEAEVSCSSIDSYPFNYGLINACTSITISQGEWIGAETNTLGKELRPTIAKWYYAIRNFALVVMMIILLYIGIRIMLCGVSSEKAKYKNMLMDWVVAICLILIMQYIMVFAMNVVDGIIKIFGVVNDKTNYIQIYEYDKKIIDGLEKAEIDTSQIVTKNKYGDQIIVWDAKNIVGLARVKAALNNSGTYIYIGWSMCYLVLVFYTVFFLFTYLKRALYLTFFTIIAPLVAMTYPIDKLHDGKAQAFDMWFKEYIFNLMIQPVHLLLYTVLISSAFELASKNILYTLVAIGFLMPAEKFLRKMFGFDKAQTPGFLSGAAGTALMMTGLNRLFNRRHSKGGKDKGDGNDESKDGEEQGKFKDMTNPFKLAGGGAGGAGGGAGGAGGGAGGAGGGAGGAGGGTGGAGGGTGGAGGAGGGTGGAGGGTGGAGGGARGGPRTGTGGNTRNGFFKKHMRALGRATKRWGKQKFIRAGKSMASGKPIKAIARTMGGIYLGAGGALLGTTFALADDEPIKKLQQNVPTLAAAGYAFGSQDIKPDPDMDSSVKEEYKRGLYDTPEEYEEALLQERIDKIIQNEKNQRKIRDNLGLDNIEEARRYMEDYRESIGSGVTDMDDLATIINLVEDGQMDKDMATTAAKYYKKAGGKPKNMGKKDRENIEFIYQNIAKANGITDPAQIDNTVKIMLSNLDLYGSYKDQLKEV